ncbi:cell division protein SepF [Fusobacterium perfoetens]|uniref:cell division protein SepF n=1 Tax=Fusobacterium perfoetens TaxID=852 RepID=UPI000684C0DC|nr:cell division protein SepF [Fusobacterium perfoetens]MCI6153242.1 cell division protein SepF [Fusobacterium perfoetens]MDY3238343.1 cell division protein SepF [Fusobacterium perfoetens]
MKKNKGLLNNLFGFGIDLEEDEQIEKDEKINLTQMEEDTEIEIEEIKENKIETEIETKKNYTEEPYQNFLKEENEKETYKVEKQEKVEEKKERKIESYVDVTSYQNVVSRIKGFEDSKKIARYIKENKIVTLNLEELDTETAQRVIDFLSGAMSMKEASLVEISKCVYVSVPKNQRVLFEGQRNTEKFFREAGK